MGDNENKIPNLKEGSYTSYKGPYPYLPGLRNYKQDFIKILLLKRREAMKRLYEEDFKTQNEELKIIGKAYILRDP